MIFYFLKEGPDEIGPLTLDQLKSSTVKKDTPVWFAGLEEWTTAEEVYELKELFNACPPRSRFLKSKLGKIWNRFFGARPKKAYRVVLNKDRKNLN